MAFMIFVRSIIVSLILLCCVILGSIVYFAEHNWFDLAPIEHVVRSKPSIIYDDRGNELARFELDRRQPVLYNQIPEVVAKAFVAAEDHNFFSHSGISLKGIIRSALVNLWRGTVVQGASTITQQVARLNYLSNERTLSRKIKELFLALHLERYFSKEQILQRYLNTMYFGRGIYGVQAACKRFWNKSVSDVTLPEAASLAAVAKSARFYSPLNAPLTARKRRNIILRSMYRLGFVTRDDFLQAKETELGLQDYIPGNPIRLYIQEWIRAWAERRWGKGALYTKGLRIQTTINQTMQTAAEKAFAAKVSTLREKIGEQLNGGMICHEVETGDIKVLIGGYDFKTSQFNRALQAQRQLGSSFKPMLYALALKLGIDMETVMVDEPMEIKMPDGQVWQPRNWTRKFEGPMTLARALTFSNNIISVKLLLNIGTSKLVTWLKLFGITNQVMPYPSLALGTAHGTVLENVAAFNVFANNGVYVKPHFISWVKNEWGKKLWQFKGERRRVLDTKLNSKMVRALSLRMDVSKQRFSKRWPACETIGKTGSTNGAATMWFVGSTPEHTCAVYLGRDDNKPMGRYVFASGNTFPIWLEFVNNTSIKKQRFYLDPELKHVSINWLTGEPVNDQVGHDIITILK